MSSVCLIDHTPATNGNLCTSCYGRLRSEIASVRGLLSELEVTITKQAKQAPPAQGGGGGAALVLNMEASLRAQALDRALRAIAWEISGGHPEIATAPVWLLDRLCVENMNAVSRLPDIGAMATELHRTALDAFKAIDRVPDKRILGKCDCGAALITHKTTGEIICPKCSVMWDVEERLASRLEAVRNHAATPEEAAGLIKSTFGVKLTPAAIRKWVTRKIITPVRPGTTRVRIGDVMDVWESKHGQLPGRKAA